MRTANAISAVDNRHRGSAVGDRGCMEDDFRIPLDISVGGKATDKAIDLLCAGGVEQLSFNTLAKAALYAPGHLHAKIGGRAGLLELLVLCFADRWERRVTHPFSAGPDLAWLPHTEGGVDGARCWHAITELAHGEARAGRSGPAETLAQLGVREQNYLFAVLSQRLGRRPTNDEVVLVQMTVHGLRAAMAAPAAPLSGAAASRVLERLLAAISTAPNDANE